MFRRPSTEGLRAKSQKNVGTIVEAQKPSLVILLRINTASGVRVCMHMENTYPDFSDKTDFSNCENHITAKTIMW